MRHDPDPVPQVPPRLQSRQGGKLRPGRPARLRCLPESSSQVRRGIGTRLRRPPWSGAWDGIRGEGAARASMLRMDQASRCSVGAATRFTDADMIRKLKSGEYRLYSRKKDRRTGKRRNLGTFKSRAAAEQHERAVQHFKRGG